MALNHLELNLKLSMTWCLVTPSSTASRLTGLFDVTRARAHVEDHGRDNVTCFPHGIRFVGTRKKMIFLNLACIRQKPAKLCSAEEMEAEFISP